MCAFESIVETHYARLQNVYFYKDFHKDFRKSFEASMKMLHHRECTRRHVQNDSY